MGAFQICSTNQLSEKDNNNIIEPKKKELLNENNILYESSIRYDNLITKILIIQTEKIENFFYTNDIFEIKNRHIHEKSEEDENLSLKIYYYSNIHISNYLGNINYIIIYMQCIIKDNSIKKPNYIITYLNLISTEKEGIIEQINIDLKSMLKKNYFLNSVIQYSNTQYCVLYKNDIETNEIEYKIEFYESYLNSINENEIKSIMEKHKGEEYICSFIYKNEEKIGNNYIFIFYSENNHFNLNIKKEMISIKSEQTSPDIFIKNITNECCKKGMINSTIDTGNESFIILNENL
jgi:hypothetical protein